MLTGQQDLIGKQVMVTFSQHWPVLRGKYVYEGYDFEGHWITGINGQRYVMNADILKIEEIIE